MKIKKIAIITSAAFFSLSVQAATISGEDTKTVPLVFAAPMSVALNLTPVQGLISQTTTTPITLATGSVSASYELDSTTASAFPVLKFNHTSQDVSSPGAILAASLPGDDANMSTIFVELFSVESNSWSALDSQPGGPWAINSTASQNSGLFEVKYIGNASPGTYTLSMTAAVYAQ